MATKKVTPAGAKSTSKKKTNTSAKKATAPKSTKTTKTKTEISEEDIRKKAKEIYNQRMASGEPGDPESDWLNAEKALKKSK